MAQAGAQWLNALLLRYRLRLLFAASVLLTAVLSWPAWPCWSWNGYCNGTRCSVRGWA